MRLGVIGTLRMRIPVASKMALAIAAGTVRCDGSPAPLALFALFALFRYTAHLRIECGKKFTGNFFCHAVNQT